MGSIMPNQENAIRSISVLAKEVRFPSGRDGISDPDLAHTGAAAA
jgi:hypothetical protein